MNSLSIVLTVTLLLSPILQATSFSREITPEEARSIAKDAYIYANPIVDSYRIMHAYFIDEDNPDFKTPLNKIYNEARLYTAEDTAVQAPNADTPYSWIGLDLRDEPIVITIPEIEDSRYFSVQLVDAYTHIIGYIGSRVTGNGGGTYMIAGPGWQGETPQGVQELLRSETELGIAIHRTQLFSADDMGEVEKIQAGYKAVPLSEYLGETPKQSVLGDGFLEPLSVEELRSSPQVFNQLNFLMQFWPVHPSEVEQMARFAKLGIEPGKKFDHTVFPKEIQAAIELGIADAWKEFGVVQGQAARGELTSGDVFGTRDYLKNNYLLRMAGAVLGIWGNVEDEAMYPTYQVDSKGRPLNGENRYTLYFPKGELPPVNSFWSLTMYRAPELLFVDNPLDRYLLNSTMLDDFERDPDGGITLYIQNESPEDAQEDNWLPAPKGPFTVTMRLYWPKTEALNGTWQEPPLELVE